MGSGGCERVSQKPSASDHHASCAKRVLTGILCSVGRCCAFSISGGSRIDSLCGAGSGGPFTGDNPEGPFTENAPDGPSTGDTPSVLSIGDIPSVLSTGDISGVPSSRSRWSRIQRCTSPRSEPAQTRAQEAMTESGASFWAE